MRRIGGYVKPSNSRDGEKKGHTKSKSGVVNAEMVSPVREPLDGSYFVLGNHVHRVIYRS